MAIKAQTTRLRMETALSAGTAITAITAANPPVVSSASHGASNGDIIKIAGISAGMVEVNNRAFVADSIASGTINLKGVKGLGYSAWTAGGTVYRATMTDVAEIRGIQFGGGQSSKIDVTNLLSFAKEYVYGLRDIGSITLDLFLNNTDTGQVAMRDARDSGVAKVFSVRASDTLVMAFVGVVTGATFNMAVDGAFEGQMNVELLAAETWFA